MRKFKVIEPTLNINWSKKYIFFYFNQFGTLLWGARLISNKFKSAGVIDVAFVGADKFSKLHYIYI